MAKKPKKAAKRKATPRATLVVDRSRLPLGSEARLAVNFLRQYGANPSLAPRPGIDPDEAREFWLQTRSRSARKLPLWVIDLAAAILAQIPMRQDRPANRPADKLTTDLEFWVNVFGMTPAKGARWVVSADAYRRERDESADQATDLDGETEKLARRIYKKRKRGVPKPK
ncbi:hypothetical protein [Bradyrhizobium sp. McL0616]|uniref:hypothetical protein n=1 Tax=Bradyrhizobium sp. McL0616 TaxID=3415674 RepID=UPI003CF7A6A7